LTAPGGDAANPTVLRIVIGAQLRGLREAQGLTCEQAGEHVRMTDSAISRMETGKVPFDRPRSRRNVADLLTLYGVTDDEERSRLFDLISESGKPGWWQRYGDVLPSWFLTYVGLEGATSLLRTYALQLIPGLLQTPDYARAVLSSGLQGGPAEDVERRVRLRMDRQRILGGVDGPRVWAVLDESVLRRLIGGPKVMRAQLEHLIDLTEHPQVTLQVLPFAASARVRVIEGGTFVILRFAEPELPDVVYVEQFTSAFYLDKEADSDRYGQAFSYLAAGSTTPATTAETLSKILLEVPDE
jgi:hypothetical protein